ncbi:MAG TPA: hypothetical protein VGR11_12835 [Solirubrobacteraceae bacterium]|nr:hypothetical protein [Solirubrobacteraceae bacterium]
MTTTIGLATGLVLAGAIGMHPAHAGTYVMRNCDVPGHGNALMYPWQADSTPLPGFSVTDACATGGGVGFNVDESVSGGHDTSILLIKPTGERSQIKFVKLVLWFAARLAGSGQPLNFFSTDLRSGGVSQYGLSTTPPGSENIVADQQLSPDTSMVRLVLRCGGPGAAYSRDTPCVAANRVPLLVRGMEVTLSEDVPPIVLQPGGPLLQGGPQRGIRTLTYAASDSQSGLNKVEVLLGETVVASQDLTPRCPYADFTVCPASEHGSFEIDTRAVTNGAHRLMVRVQDAAGNARVVYGETAVEVANELTPAASTDPREYTLTARFEQRSGSTLTVPYGRRVSVRGRLSQGSVPVAAGTLIDVLERRDRRGAREVSRAHVKTKADGSFSAVLATTRPSRTVRLAYRPVEGNQVVSPALRLRVRAASRLRASLRGRVVRFSGRVLSRPIPKAGKRVLMEGRAPGSAWTTFRRLRADRKGRFSGAYRLRVRRPGVTLKIRALVRSEAGYGYLSSRSRAVTLRVR